MNRHTAFTLVELLVVITIMEILLALLTPALERAIEQAERVACGSQLHAWGVAIPQYYLDNRRKLMSANRHFGSAVYPNLAWAHNEDLAGDWATGNTKAEDWTEPRIGPYIGRVSGGRGGSVGLSVDTITTGWGGLWYCPANKAPGKDQQNINAANVADWFVSDYAYFGRSDIWGKTHSTKPEELIGRDLDGGRIMMADAIYLESQEGWWFNHGVESWSTHDVAWGGPKQTYPDLSGTNRLAGDGSVRWKDLIEFDRDAMDVRSTSEPFVTTNSGPDPAGNLNFY